MSKCVYTKNRPIRHSFYVDTMNSNIQEQLDSIINYSMNKWGGRFNQILPLNLLNDETTLKFLNSHDPDYIQCFSDIDDISLRNIENNCNPIYLKKDLSEKPDIAFGVNPAGIYPLDENVEALGYSKKSTFLHFTPYKNVRTKNSIDFIGCTPVVQRFLKLNFGYYNSRELVEYYYSGPVLEKTVVNEDDLVTSFIDINNVSSIVSPNQFASLTPSFKEYNTLEQQQYFIVVIGSSPSDIIYYWNRIHYLRRHQLGQICGLWVPEEFLSNAELLEQIKNYVDKVSKYHWNGEQYVKFVSSSLNESILREVSESLKPEYSHMGYEVINSIIHDVDLDFLLTDRASYTLNTFVDNRAYIDIKTPTNLTDTVKLTNYNNFNSWMLDVYADFRLPGTERFIGKYKYWQYPRRHPGILRGLFPDSNYSRITRDGIPTVTIDTKRQNVLFELISEDRIFDLVFLTSSSYYYMDDLRNKSKELNIESNYSDMGNTFRRFLGLFGNLYNANQYFVKPLWRNIFDKFTEKYTKKFNQYKTKTTARISKYISRNKLDAESLAGNVMKLARELANKEQGVDYGVLLEELKKQLTLHLQTNPDFGLTELDMEEEFKSELQELIEKNVILMGLTEICENCRFKNWFPIDTLNYKLSCIGCNSTIIMRPEAKWVYRLNSIVTQAIDSYLIPVMLTLGYIDEYALQSNSFYFSPHRTLKLNNDDKEYTDLDIICVLDGKLIIGEVKQSISDFHSDDFQKIKSIALLIKPSIVVFSWMNGDMSKAISDQLNILQNEFDSYGIKIRCLQLEKYFTEPDYYCSTKTVIPFLD